jgi:SDR family mycofactocin-dependent oxidoreductase
MRFEGKAVLITGGARGQGRAHAERFAAEGARVAVCDIASGSLETVPYPLATREELDQSTAELALQADVRRAEDMERVVADVIEAFGRIDVLVCNAGICSFGPIGGMAPEVWQTTIDVNLTGVFNAVRAVAPEMVDRRYGRIVATASMAGRAGWENIGHYAASKWGVIGLIKSLALELAPRGVTANVVCPSSVNTTMMHNDAAYKLFRPDLEHPTREDALPAFASVNLIPEPYAEPSDISDAVLFLASDEARFITGATLSPSMGLSASNV